MDVLIKCIFFPMFALLTLMIFDIIINQGVPLPNQFVVSVTYSKPGWGYVRENRRLELSIVCSLFGKETLHIE